MGPPAFRQGGGKMTGWLRLLRNRRLTLANLLDELLPFREDRIAGCMLDPASTDGGVLSVQRFSELHREVAAMSRFLVEEAGMRPGDRVGIFRSNDVRSFRWFLAAIRAGGIAVPLNPLLTLAELREIVPRSGASIMITDHAAFSRTVVSREALPVRCWVQGDEEAPLDGALRLTADWLQAPAVPPARVAPEATVAVFYTSGTEGFPKGATLSSQALLAGRAAALLVAPLAGRVSRALFPLPWAHIMAVSTAVCGLLAGVPGYFLPRFETQAAVAAIRRHKLTAVIGVPAMYIRLVNAAPSRESLASVRLWLSASDHLPAAYRRKLLSYGGVFLNVYGMAELGGLAMFSLAGRIVPGDGELCLPVPPFRVRVVDERGGAAQANTVGECQIHGPGVTGKYWGDSEDRAPSMTTDGWLRTGDLAVRNRLGLIRLAGRAKDVIKCGGYSIFAREVEEVLAAHPAVVRVAVIGVPHPEKGEEPMAVVECRPESRPEDEELHAWCRLRLASYKTPRRILLVEPGALPQGVTEKILKRTLRERFAGESVRTGEGAGAA